MSHVLESAVGGVQTNTCEITSFLLIANHAYNPKAENQMQSLFKKNNNDYLENIASLYYVVY